jgi:drug/metabolite transporter (DMT)-like permease
MIAYGLFWNGERLSGLGLLGFGMAVAGLTALMLPGVATPGIWGSAAMLTAGVAWGVYSLRGRREPPQRANSAASPTAVTAGNFLRATPLALGFSALLLAHLHLSTSGVLFAVASGALTSGWATPSGIAYCPICKPPMPQPYSSVCP